jgi:hypothetical protein
MADSLRKCLRQLIVDLRRYCVVKLRKGDECGMKTIKLSNNEIDTLLAALNYKEIDFELNDAEKELYRKLIEIRSRENA